jgi:mono/diheme cytochrome c family protein
MMRLHFMAFLLSATRRKRNEKERGLKPATTDKICGMQIRRTVLAAGLALSTLVAIRVFAQAPAQGARGGRGGAITNGYPTRPPADPAALDRGKMLYGTNCAFCHGNDARGGDGGSNLLRSDIVLDDKDGELIGDILRNGVSSMPKFELSKEQISDIAAFIHSFRVGGYDISRLRPETIVVGNAKSGEAYFKAKCASCHDTAGDLNNFAARIADSRLMQQTWLLPGARGTRPSKAPGTRVVVTLASGQQLEGELVRIDDFIVTLIAADATQHTVRRNGAIPKVEVRDPVQAHKDLLRVYTDKDIHNVTAYLESLK